MMKNDLKDLEIKVLHTVNELRKAYLLEKGIITVDHEELLYKILDFGPYDENCRDLANTLIEEMDDLKDYLQKSFIDSITLSGGEKLVYMSNIFKEKLKKIFDISRSTRDKLNKAKKAKKAKIEEMEKFYDRDKLNKAKKAKIEEMEKFYDLNPQLYLKSKFIYKNT